MATRPLIPQTIRALLGNYDGATVGVLLVDHDGAAAADESMEFVSEVAGDELLDPGDRGTVDVIVSQDGNETVLDLDPEGDTYAPDTTGTTPAGAWFFDTTGADDTARKLIVFLPVAEGPGFADWALLAPEDGLARLKAKPGEFAQLDDVDWSTPPTDGQFFAWSAALGKLAPVDAPSGGGGSPGTWTNWTVASPWANEATLFGAPVPVLSAQIQPGAAIAQIAGIVLISGADAVTAITGGSGTATLSVAAPSGQRPAHPQPVTAQAKVYWASFAKNMPLAIEASIAPAGDLTFAFASNLGDGVTDLLAFLGEPDPGNPGVPADFVVFFLTGTYPLA